MKRLALLLVAALLLTVVALPALSADEVRSCTTDPDDGSRLPECGTRADNECYEGGTMAGKCTNEWLWKAGWEIARFNDGRLTREQVNAEWAFLLDPPVEGVAGVSTLLPGCYQSNNRSYDLEYYGPIDTIGNYTMWDSTDGSCSGKVVYEDAIIYATSEAAALNLCEILWNDIYIWVDHLIEDYPGIPAGYWDCYLD